MLIVPPGGAVGGALAALVLVGLGFVGWLLWRRRQQGQGLLKGRRPSLDADFDHSRNMAEHGAAGQYSSVPGTSSSATSPALNSSNYFGRQPSIYQGGGADGLDLHGGNAPPSYDLASEGLRNSLGPTSTNFSTADNSGPESSNTPTSSSPLSLPAGASGGHPHSNKGIFAANGLTQQNH